jgi:hypothetical protein
MVPHSTMQEDHLGAGTASLSAKKAISQVNRQK